MKKLWIIGFLVTVIALLSIVASKTVAIDPYFHFHMPNTDTYFYRLNNQRSQNDGISRNFEYEGLITGTSMTENFKASEAKDIFGVDFIKVPYSGGTYNEINLNLAVAAKYNEKLKYIIRGLDMSRYFDEKDMWRTDLGTYPKYLYDDNWFNDVEYVFNRDVLFSRVYPMTKENDNPDFQGGMTSFDAYSNWMSRFTFGYQTLYPDGLTVKEAAKPIELTQNEIDVIRANIQQNVTALANQYPNITFYYFITPYSAAWWYSVLVSGKLDRQIDAEQIVIEEILKCDNIKLFSFNCQFDITTDLNNYKDNTHYGEWINSLMLRYMYDGRCQLSPDNYLSYIEEERSFYRNYDYSQLTNQEDYVNDYYAAALFNNEITGTKPYFILNDADSMELSNATIERDQYNGQKGLICTGSLSRPSGSEIKLSEYLRDYEYVGAKVFLPDITPFKYLVFYGKKITNHGQLTVRLYDEDGNEIAACDENYHNLDKEWHQYVVDISKAKGMCTLILNGGYIDSTGSADSSFVFSEIGLY